MQTSQPTHDAFLYAAAATVPTYEAQIHEWIASLPPSLSFDGPAASDDICRFVLRGHAAHALEMIYWPFLAARLSRPISDWPALMPFADLAQKALNHHALRIALNKPGFEHRHHGTYLMIEACSRSALIFLAADMYNERVQSAEHPDGGCPLGMPPRWVELIASVKGLLDYWSSETRAFDEVRYVLSRKAFDGA